jgi:hypothetical protein
LTLLPNLKTGAKRSLWKSWCLFLNRKCRLQPPSINRADASTNWRASDSQRGTVRVQGGRLWIHI